MNRSTKQATKGGASAGLAKRATKRPSAATGPKGPPLRRTPQGASSALAKPRGPTPERRGVPRAGPSRPGPGAAPTPTAFELRGEHIALDALLKATGLVDSGGAAKQVITAGEVCVDGQVELRRSCKIRAGQWVEFAGARLRIVGAQDDHAPTG